MKQTDNGNDADDGPRWAHALIGVLVGGFTACGITNFGWSVWELAFVVLASVIGAIGGYYIRGRLWRRLGL